MASDVDEAAVSFADLGLGPELCGQLVALEYHQPTPVQQAALPVLLAGRDLVAQAATGTGKTAAFSLPLLERLDLGRRQEPRLLVLAPTRELAVQVATAMEEYADPLDLAVVAVFGGQPIGHQIRDLRRGADVIVATPGRALDHLTRGTMSFDAVEAVVLDEADEMLDMGFAEELEALLSATPPHRQTALFSATMPPRIRSIAKRHLHDPATFDLTGPTEPGDISAQTQIAYIVDQRHKAAALGRILELEDPDGTIVFCRTRDDVDTVAEQLVARGLRAEPLHGGMSQDQRDRALARLRSKGTDVLVATDVAARGLDVAHLSHVVNHDVPTSPDAYVHRIGRVGRAGRSGVAITLADPRARRRLADLERVTRADIEVRPVPSAAEVADHRLERAVARVVEHAATDTPLDVLAVRVEATGVDPLRLAAAAVALLGTVTGPDDGTDIPPIAGRRDNKQRPDLSRGDGRARGQTLERPQRRLEGPTTRIFIGAGRRDKVRPNDLVGAFTGETDLRGRDIGNIEIRDKFSLVEVPAPAADAVVRAMRAGTVRGRKVTVRRDRDA
jgi:ATP-dependent RNA helicase DeaD